MDIETEINIFFRLIYTVEVFVCGGCLLYIHAKVHHVKLKKILKHLSIWSFLLGTARIAAIVIAFFTTVGDAIIPLLVNICFWGYICIALSRFTFRLSNKSISVNLVITKLEELMDLQASNIQQTDELLSRIKQQR